MKNINIRCINSNTGNEIFDKNIDSIQLDMVKEILKVKLEEDKTIIKIKLPEIYIKYLEYLENNDYGTKQDIITSCGLHLTISTMFLRAKQDEERKKEEG